MRVVLDTDVLVSAFVFPGGAAERVYRLALAGRIQLITSVGLVAELGTVLGRKFGWEPTMTEEVVVQLARIAEVVVPRASVDDADPAKSRAVETARAGRVDVVAASDDHLLRLGSREAIPIEAPAIVLERLR